MCQLNYSYFSLQFKKKNTKIRINSSTPAENDANKRNSWKCLPQVIQSEYSVFALWIGWWTMRCLYVRSLSKHWPVLIEPYDPTNEHSAVYRPVLSAKWIYIGSWLPKKADHNNSSANSCHDCFLFLYKISKCPIDFMLLMWTNKMASCYCVLPPAPHHPPPQIESRYIISPVWSVNSPIAIFMHD